jgi:hypothetical protein
MISSAVNQGLPKWMGSLMGSPHRNPPVTGGSNVNNINNINNQSLIMPMVWLSTLGGIAPPLYGLWPCQWHKNLLLHDCYDKSLRHLLRSHSVSWFQQLQQRQQQPSSSTTSSSSSSSSSSLLLLPDEKRRNRHKHEGHANILQPKWY